MVAGADLTFVLGLLTLLIGGSLTGREDSPGAARLAGLVMMIAFGGAYVNFKLIALPMSAMVGGGDYITDTLQASEVAALVIILFETLMGLFLMETLRFTSLFPFGR